MQSGELKSGSKDLPGRSLDPWSITSLHDIARLWDATLAQLQAIVEE